MRKRKQRPMTVCQITVYPDRRRIRIEGDYVFYFYRWLKEFIPWKDRSYVEQGRYWMVEKRFFCRIFETAYEYFDKILLFENDRGVEEYVTGISWEPETDQSFCRDRADSYWKEQTEREEQVNP